MLQRLSTLVFARSGALAGAQLSQGAVATPASLTSWRRHMGFGSHVSDNDPEILEKAKQRHLKGETKSRIPHEAPGWEEVLASDSEAIVKAERSDTRSIKEMQEETVECIIEEEKDRGGGDPETKQRR